MEDAPVETPAAWLAQFPPEAQPLIAAWFAYAVGQRPQTPDGLLAIVKRVVSRKLDWSVTPGTREVCTRVLLALCDQRAGARTYAATVLAQQAVV